MDAQEHFILDKIVNYNGPVRILQGDKDALVPYQTAFKIKDILTSKDTLITLIKEGDHALSTPEHLSILGKTFICNFASSNVGYFFCCKTYFFAGNFNIHAFYCHFFI